MKISKTMFKEFSRCNRVYHLDELYKKQGFSSKFDLDNEEILEILNLMFDSEGEDLIADNAKVEAMMEYYNEVEVLAMEMAKEKFNLNILYGDTFKSQAKCFFVDEANHEFYSYLDGFSIEKDTVYAFEVKATTSKKFREEFKTKDSGKESLFIYNHLDVLVFNPNFIQTKHVEKLFNKLGDIGMYIYDCAITYYYLKNDLKYKDKKVKFYLAVLNSDYVYDGSLINKENKDFKKVIDYIDITSILEEYYPTIFKEKELLVNNLKLKEIPKLVYGKKCGFKGQECKFFPVCWEKLKGRGSILEYFRVTASSKIDLYEKLNNEETSLLDVEDINLTPNQLIQKEVFISGSVHMNKEKISKAISLIKHPIYYLDFETFASPLPRFIGEKPYAQSLFQYSLHVEKTPFKCDFDKDHYEYLVKDAKDYRRELIEKLIKDIDLKKGGSVIVYNASFESTRLKEMALIFPEYEKEINKIRDSLFDLQNLLKAKSSLYEALGYDEEEAKINPYYHNDLAGSYSIKKVLPIFSNLTYSSLDIKNGGEAIIAYAMLARLEKEDREILRSNLIKYCKQDTWAMVLILHNIIKEIRR
ncbi:MAG: DUF2779 domain-containing protein [Bacilli bacterium]